MRTLVPAETLVYLETNDLAAALQPIVDSKPFTEVAKSKPDFSALKGVQLAVAVTGFETSEEKVNDEQSIGKVRPRFVAVADTHAWNYQAVAFAEHKLSSFVADIYNSQPKLEKSDKHGGKYFTWTAADGRKAYALVIDSLVWFGNDETAIDRCLAVWRSEADSIITTGKVRPAEPGTLARGYVSTYGVAQIANLAAMKLASDASDETEVQSAIAEIVPEVLRSAVTEMSWTSAKSEHGIEDKYSISMPSEIADRLAVAMESGGEIDSSIFEGIPRDASGVTIYNLQQPAMAWQGLQSLISDRTDAVSARMISLLMANDLDSYGVADSDKLMRSIRSPIMTVKLKENGSGAVVAKIESLDTFHESIIKWTQVSGVGKNGVHWDGYKGSFVASAGSFTAFGDIDAVSACHWASRDNDKRLGTSWVEGRKLLSPITTLSFMEQADIESVARTLFSTETSDVATQRGVLSETRFTGSGMERTTTSDFGLIGQIIAQIVDN